MNKQEVIETLEKKRETALDNFEYYRDKENEKYEKMNRARVDSYTLAIQLVEQIDKPQPEKVEVPDFVAEFIEVGNRFDKIAFLVHQKYLGINSMMKECPVKDWLRSVDYETVLSLVNGYTVKQKRWVVKAPNGKYFISLAYGSGIGSLKKCSAKTKDDAYPFDDKSKAEAVATLVEGSVEEV